tara:strand:+ start:2360 stop:3199 length:840 start_codon:yes stop_codon:yes gene_type:complete
LDLLNRHDAGETVEWGDEKWEVTLKVELNQTFTPAIRETLSLSASAIETYLDCPLKYRFRQVDKIPESPSRPQLTFGTIIHRVLDRFHVADGALSAERIVVLLNEEWRPAEFEYSEREKKLKSQAVEMLTRYAERISTAPPNVLETELSFSFDLDDVRISGKIDRIDDTECGKEVVDYKTSKRSTPAKKSIQLSVYSLYLQQCEDGKLSGIPDKATLYFLRDKEQPKHSHSFSENELELTKEKIADVAKRIRGGKFEPSVGFHCDWCDYKTLACPSWES